MRRSVWPGLQDVYPLYGEMSPPPLHTQMCQPPVVHGDGGSQVGFWALGPVLQFATISPVHHLRAYQKAIKLKAVRIFVIPFVVPQKCQLLDLHFFDTKQPEK